LSTDSDSPATRPARPDPIAVNYDGIPDDLKERSTWICWRYAWKADREKWTKLPVDASSGDFAKSNDSDTWADFDTAKAYHQNPDTESDGLGFMFDPEDWVVGIDLDDVRDSSTGRPSDTAKDVIDTLDSFTEVSPSGTGYHILVYGSLPAEAKNRRGDVEIYSQGRFFTVTGEQVDGTPATVARRQKSLESVHREYVAQEATDEGTSAPTGGTETADLSDRKLIEKAKNAEHGDTFTRLWNGNTTGYESPSEADYALIQQLLWWTQGDKNRTDRLFRRSGLNRDKWEAREDYRSRTLKSADRNLSGYYDPAEATPEGSAYTNPPEAIGTGGEAPDLLTPAHVVTNARLDPDEYDNHAEAISKLNDREKAAVVWELLKGSDSYHVRVRRDNGALYGYENGMWKPDGERTLRHAGRKALGSTNYGQNVLRELKTQARGDPDVEVPSEVWGLNPGYLAVENGLLHLRAASDGTDALRELEPEDYALTRLPVTYDPDADCEEWTSFVDDVVESDKVPAFQEYVGYTLHRGEVPFSKALLLVGDGANGKSTALNVVRAMLGESNTRSKAIHDFAEANHIADLHGAIANIHADLSEGALSASGISKFKSLTGGDSMEGRQVYGESFTFNPSAKHLYAANTTPDVGNYVGSEDSAWWRRWLVIHFPRYFPPEQRDPTLERRLTTDEALSGILNWAIEGWTRLNEQWHFTNDDTTQETRRRWLTWGDSAEQFIESCVEHDPDAENRSTGDVYQVYTDWCEREDEDPIGRRKFTATLRDAPVSVGYAKRVRPGGTGSPTNGYKSLGFTDEAPSPPEWTDDESESDGDGHTESRATGLDSFGGEE
jgi:P4 family phage/plasmid primase-like protien